MAAAGNLFSRVCFGGERREAVMKRRLVWWCSAEPGGHSGVAVGDQRDLTPAGPAGPGPQ